MPHSATSHALLDRYAGILLDVYGVLLDGSGRLPGVRELIGELVARGKPYAIVTNDAATAAKFTAGVDSAAVMVNASTRFNDGGEFGLGAEIGISTDKFHARGPCGVDELTSYKYIVHGSGQVRT